MLPTEAEHKVKKRMKEEDDDRISQLPNPILHHILSLILTKEAAVTVVLSKKWRSLWNSIPVIDLGNGYLIDLRKRNLSVGTPQPQPRISNLLMNFVDCMFHNREDSSTIDVFSFYCDQFCDSSRVYLWVSKLIKHKIRHLTLGFHRNQLDFVFPLSLFTCETLVHLKLQMSCLLKFPTRALPFPNLKFLVLKDVTFSDYYSTQQLFSFLPVLEDLSISCCKFLNLNSIDIFSPMLKKLQIVDKPTLPTGGVDNYKFSIFTPTLMDIFFMGSDTPQNIDIGHLPCLIFASFNFDIENRDLKHWNHVPMKILASLSNVRRLDIAGHIVEAVFGNEDFSTQFPTFIKLICVRIKLGYRHLGYRTLLNLLQATPNLKYLYVDKARCRYNNVDFPSLTTVPQCLLLHLSDIDIGEISGIQCELHVIELLLKNARVLEKVIIRTCADITKKKRNDLSKWLEKIPIHSRKCRTYFL